MVSRRNFFSIMVMMAVLFFMFQFSQVFKNQGNNYDLNEYAEKERPKNTGKKDKIEETVSDSDADREARIQEALDNPLGYVVYVGDTEDAVGRTVREWCTYAKLGIICTGNFREFTIPNGNQKPILIFVDTDQFDSEEELELVTSLAEENALKFVFCNAPGMEEMKKKSDFAEFLGLETTGANTAKTVGLQIFPDFILGGETIYEPPRKMDEEKAAKIQDMDYTIPWYVTGRGTKTYMVGMMEDKDMDKEDYPAIIWRNTYKKSQVYVVTGGYMESAGGFGIINGIMYELSDYYLYPVVNARTVLLVDFPGFAYENEDRLMGLYARSQQAVMRDIMWPSITAMAKQEKITLSCMVNVQYDYTDDIWPQSADVEFYLQQLKEMGGEAGWSLKEGKGADIAAKISTDAMFFEALDSAYKYSAVYTDTPSETLLESLESSRAMKDVVTVAAPHTDADPYLSYYNDNVTLQSMIADAMDYTYSRDLDTRGLITSLGYTGVMLNIHNVIWPESQEDQWENYYENVSSYLSSFWNMYPGFDRVTITESDYRVRNFLNLTYTQSRTGDTIRVNIKNSVDSWFVLRTHDEEIASADGCTYEKLEENAYLIHIEGISCSIRMKDSEGSIKF